jgi:23S rRNA-/tRNA-specific pseudouridylate synthase
MNILLVSNSDICRSRMAQKILSSFGHGTKIFTSGVLPGRVVPSSVVGVMEQNGYDCSRKKASDVDIYCHQPWDYVITLCEENPLLKKHYHEMPLEIVYEDNYLVVINKPAGMLSVPGKGEIDSVYQYIKILYPDATGPLIVHRLDMATSGVLLIAKNKEVHQHLQAQFKNRMIKKRYIALLDGNIYPHH